MNKEFSKNEFDRLVYLYPNLLPKINELAQEFNYDYHYEPNDLIEIFLSSDCFIVLSVLISLDILISTSTSF